MKNLTRYLLLTILLILLSGIVPAGAAKRLPMDDIRGKQVETIHSKTYLGDVQVWDIECTADGLVFAATANGVSVFDGVRWRICGPDNNPIFRALCYDPSDERLYAAADNEFGYLSKNVFGKWEYKRIFENYRAEIPDIFWRVAARNGYIYFQTHSKVYCYCVDDGRIDILEPGGELGYLHSVDDGLYLQVADRVMKLTGVLSLEDYGVTVQGRIVNMFGQNGSMVMVTEENGIRIRSADGVVAEAPAAINELLKSVRVFRAERFDGSHFLLGSILDGVFIVDDKWNVTERISTGNGLRYSTVLSIEATSDGNIWIGLDGGMAFLDNHPSYSLLQNKSGDMGRVYDVAFFEDALYAATNKGLFRIDQNSRFEFIPGTQGQVWRLIPTVGKMIVCHDSGVFIVSEGRCRRQSFERIWQLAPLPNRDDLWVSADFDGGFSIHNMKGGMRYVKKVEGYSGAHTDMAFDRNGFLWIQDRQGNAVRIMLDERNDVAECRKFIIEDSVRQNIYRTDIDGDAVFFSGRTAWVYDRSSDDMAYHEHYSLMLQTMLFAPDYIRQTGDHFFYISRNETGLLKRVGNRYFDYGVLSLPDDEMNAVPAMARRIIPLDATWSVMGMQNGMAFYNLRRYDEIYSQPRQPMVESAEILTPEGEYHSLPIDSEYALPHSYLGLRIYFTNLFPNKQIRYSIDQHPWATSYGDGYLDLPPLKYGSHTVRIRNADSPSGVSGELSVMFRVATPWWLSWKFIVSLIILLAILILSIQRIVMRMFNRQRDILIRKQNLRIEREKKEYEIGLLRMQLHEQEKQLMNLTMGGVKRNAMLADLKKTISTHFSYSDSSKDSAPHVLRKLERKVDSYMNDQENWTLFENYFNTIYDGFFDRLRRKHPELSSGEMRICAFLKLNLSTKEIAVYLNISPSSVEIARHRLRKKMKLDSDVNLKNYIATI